MMRPYGIGSLTVGAHLVEETRSCTLFGPKTDIRRLFPRMFRESPLYFLLTLKDFDIVNPLRLYLQSFYCSDRIFFSNLFPGNSWIIPWCHKLHWFGLESIAVNDQTMEGYLRNHTFPAYRFPIVHRECGQIAYYCEDIRIFIPEALRLGSVFEVTTSNLHRAISGYQSGYRLSYDPLSSRMYPTGHRPVFKDCRCFSCGRDIGRFESEKVYFDTSSLAS